MKKEENRILIFWSRYKNFGDEIVPYLFQKMSATPFKYVHHENHNTVDYLINIIKFIGNILLFRNPRIFRFSMPGNRKVILSIGSILNCSNENSIVWGSGIIRKDDIIRGGDFRAVRGPLSRNRLIDLGFNVPEIYGDPALLLPLFYMPTNISKDKIGILPHLVDYKNLYERYAANKSIILFNLNDPVEEIINSINKCKYILSSSLHGLIVSHSYGIPALWIRLGNIGGDDIKFYDYFSSVGIRNYKPFSDKFENIDNLFKENNEISMIDKTKLLEIQCDLLISAPFPISEKAEKIKQNLLLLKKSYERL